MAVVQAVEGQLQDNNLQVEAVDTDSTVQVVSLADAARCPGMAVVVEVGHIVLGSIGTLEGRDLGCTVPSVG